MHIASDDQHTMYRATVDQYLRCLVAGYADSTVDLIDALGLEQPDVLGWSLGGDIALSIAVNYADMVNRVVVADTTSGGVLGRQLNRPLDLGT